MGRTSTKQDIVDAVVETAQRTSIKSVHIAKLIKELGINRNTFYYYFESKYDVAMYVFRTDLARFLEAEIPRDELLYAPVSPEKEGDALPFYMRREIGAHLLDLGDFYKALVRCVMSRQAFYGGLFDNKDAEFKALIDGLYHDPVADDLRIVLGGRYMPPETFEFLTTAYAGRIYLIPSYHLARSAQSESLLDDRVNPFWNLPYEALTYGLQTHPINRIRR